MNFSENRSLTRKIEKQQTEEEKDYRDGAGEGGKDVSAERNREIEHSRDVGVVIKTSCGLDGTW